MATTTTISEDGLVLYPETSSLERLRFFFGQLLTQRDLEAEQRYHLTLRRLTQRETFGTGTVAGLGVTAAGQDVAPLSVFVHPGLAFDPDGRELILEAMECIPVAEPSVETETYPLAGGTPETIATSLVTAFGAPITGTDVEELEGALRECGMLAPDSDFTALKDRLEQIPQLAVELEPPVLLRDYLFDQLVGVTFVGLRYREVGTDPAPAVLDASCCGGVSCFPTRTSQGVYIAVSSDPFPAIEDPYTRLRECIDSQFFEQMEAGGPGYPVDPKAALCACLTSTGAWRGLPPTDEACGTPSSPIVPLAKVCWRRFDDEVLPNILHVDNCFWRPLAPGVPAIRALLESYASGVRPENLLPRVVEISPADNQSFSASETAGDDFIISARMDAVVTAAPGVSDVWQLVYYPESGPVVPYNSGSATGPGGSAMDATLLDPGMPSGRLFELSFTGSSGFEAGTYVWRLQVPSTTLKARNGQDLDGQPNPPNAVPSGNGAPGGVFEARFVVVAD